MQTIKLYKILIFSLLLALSLPVATVKANNINQLNGRTPKEPVPSSSVPVAPLFTDRIIIKFNALPGIRSTQPDWIEQKEEALSESAGEQLRYLRTMSGDAHIFSINQRQPYPRVLAIAQKLAARTDVKYAEPDQLMQHTLEPTDPLYPNQWHYRYEACPDCWAGVAYGINLPPAWEITTGSENVVVAVIDTGILPHADIADKLMPGYDFISDLWIARDGDERDDDPSDPGDWVVSSDGCGFTSDSSWHGLHVAGTIAARTNNDLGISGISWGAKILPVRVLGRCGGYTSDIVDGMRWAAGLNVAGAPDNNNPAQVLNLSLGSSGSCGSTYQNAINDILENTNAVIVIAAGNSSVDVNDFRPANCDGVVTVAATDIDSWRASYSNYGSLVEISAPGGEFTWDSGILSTLNTGTTFPLSDTYAAYQGTSTATPHVSGVVALMLSLNPGLTQTQVLGILQQTARNFHPGSDCTPSTCGAGILDAGAAIQASLPPPAPFNKTSPANGTINQLQSPTISWENSAGVASYEYCLGSSDASCNLIPWTSTGTQISAGLSHLIGNTTYYWQVRANNLHGITYANDNNWYSFTTTSPTQVTVFIGPDFSQTYQLEKDTERREYYNLSGTPVVVQSLLGENIVAAIRLQSRPEGAPLYSFIETMGVPAGLVSHKYYFPTYNNTWGPLDSQLRFSNLSGNPTTVRVTIGAQFWDYTLTGLEEKRVSYAITGGPVTVESLDPTKKIVAAIRLQSRPVGAPLYSYAETMGIPAEYVSDTYYFPTYNNIWAPLNSQLRFGNLGNAKTEIRVTIAGNVMGTYIVEPQQEVRVNYDVSGGPVVVQSLADTPAKGTTKQNIVAAIRLQSKPDGAPLYSFVETMGVPASLLSHKYYFPTYNNTWEPLNSQLRFSNLSENPTTVRVTIGATVWNYSLAGLEEKRVWYAVTGGPVIVESLDPAKKIVAAIRLQSRPVGAPLYSYAETMGIPAEFLSDTYYFPTYNNIWAPLSSQLRFGVPATVSD